MNTIEAYLRYFRGLRSRIQQINSNHAIQGLCNPKLNHINTAKPSSASEQERLFPDT